MSYPAGGAGQSGPGGQGERLHRLADTLPRGHGGFHALEAKHGEVYGYDSQSGQVLVSTDHTTWDRRARVALADFAISPADPNLMLATTQQNLARSADGGRTFTPAAAAPLVQLLDWPKATTLVGLATGSGEIHVATDNGIHTSRDGGRTFTMRVPMS